MIDPSLCWNDHVEFKYVAKNIARSKRLVLLIRLKQLEKIDEKPYQNCPTRELMRTVEVSVLIKVYIMPIYRVCFPME